MKLKIKIKDENKEKEEVIEIPGKDHLKAQMTYKSNVFKDKTKYTRKKKYKNKEVE